MGGRPNKPDAIKKFTGTYAKTRSTGDAIQFEVLKEIPVPPSYLGLKKNEGLQVYFESANLLMKAGILNTVNIFQVFQYAKEFQKYINAEKEIKKLKSRLNILHDSNGNILKMERLPLDRMSSEYLSNSLKLASELGLTPVSSSKLKQKSKEEDDDLQRLFAKYK